MLGLFKKKKEESSKNEEENGENSAETEGKAAQKEQININATDLNRLIPEIEKIKISVESFGEVRKGLNERISSLSEQIGELRAMILDRDRTIQEIELKSVKAADLVESVQPDKLMVEVQKQDAKLEALKANLDGNEAVMDRIMEELKEMRRKLDFFRGVEEIIKLSEEVKKELIEIKKVEAGIHIQTDKIDTIYSELRKKFQEVDLFNDSMQELKVNLEQNVKDINFLKTKISGLAEKDELDSLVQKVQKYIDVLKEIDKRSSLSKDLAQLKDILGSVK